MARATVARRRAFAVGLAMVVAALTMSSAGAQAQRESVEYSVKAAYAYKFGDYVVWPPQAFESPTSPVRLCVVGVDPFGEVLEATVAGEKINGRPITVHRLGVVDRASACHILYVAGSDRQSVDQALEAVRGTPALTITDETRGNAKGVIHFVIRANRVRFEIDDQSAARNGLSISSKLFSLALSVKPRT